MEKETLHARGRRLARIIRERRTREGERDRQRKGKRDRSSGELAAARYTLAAAALHARVRGVRHGAKRGVMAAVKIRVESRWLSGYLILTAAPQHLASLPPSNAP